MKLSILASTKPGYTLSKDEALLLAGHEAGICYMRDDIEALTSEPKEQTIKRVNGTIKSGHHSVFGHPTYSFIIEGVPKIIAMLLNNEHEYCTSEKSARYTTMQTSALEQEIYEKWIAKFEGLITKQYPQLADTIVHKLALENARYFISVFTPATTMGYTVNLRQANYIINWCIELAKRADESPFFEQLAPHLTELAELLSELVGVDNLSDGKGRSFSLFSNRFRKQEFGETYSVNYKGTFSQLAQAQRHRSLTYEMIPPTLEDIKFYVPPIIHDLNTHTEYIDDMKKLARQFPQGTIISINERGTAEAFALKCHERLCGAAQREICIRTKNTLDTYLEAVDPKAKHHGMSKVYSEPNPDIYNMLKAYEDKTKCQFGFYKCDRPCPLGPAMAYERLI